MKSVQWKGEQVRILSVGVFFKHAYSPALVILGANSAKEIILIFIVVVVIIDSQELCAIGNRSENSWVFNICIGILSYWRILIDLWKRCAICILTNNCTLFSIPGHIMTSPLANSLPTLPFHVLKSLFDASPLTTDDGVLLRRMSLDIGLLHLVLACLSILSHHAPRVAVPGFQQEVFRFSLFLNIKRLIIIPPQQSMKVASFSWFVLFSEKYEKVAVSYNNFSVYILKSQSTFQVLHYYYPETIHQRSRGASFLCSSHICDMVIGNIAVNWIMVHHPIAIWFDISVKRAISKWYWNMLHK